MVDPLTALLASWNAVNNALLNYLPSWWGNMNWLANRARGVIR